MRLLLLPALFLVLAGCSTTSGFGKIGKNYPGIRFNQQNPTQCRAASSEKVPTLMSFRIGEETSPKKVNGLALGTEHTHVYSADLNWIIEPDEQEIALLTGEKCQFLMKKRGEKSFSLYQLADAKTVQKVKTTPYENLWHSTEVYGGDLIKMQTREFLFDRLTVGGTPTSRAGVWDIAVLAQDGEMLRVDDVVVTDKGKIFYRAVEPLPDGFIKSASDNLVKVIHSDQTESLISSIWNKQTYGAVAFGISKAGDYPAFVTLKDGRPLSLKIDKLADGSTQYTLYSDLSSGTHNYVSLESAPVVQLPAGTRVTGIRLLMDSPSSSGGALDYDGSDEALYYFDVFENGSRAKFAVQLEHSGGKRRWHLLFPGYAAKDAIDPKGWLDLRQLNSPFPRGTVVGLGEDEKWTITGYQKNLAFTEGIDRILAEKDADLFALAEKVNPILAQRNQAFAAQREQETKKAIAEREAYIKSLPPECRKHLNAPALFRGCLEGDKMAKARAAESQSKLEREERIRQNNSREINWRKGAMSGDNYYHLDERKRTRQINNKIKCELRLSGCIH